MSIFSYTSSTAILSLLRLAIGTSDEVTDLSALTKADWRRLIALSYEQGVSAITVDGFLKALELNPDIELELDREELQDLKYEWLGQVFQFEEAYKAQINAVAALASTYSANGIDTMILKGYGLSLNYPVPAHRPVGDIDIYLSSSDSLDKLSVSRDVKIPAWKIGDEIIAKKGITVDYGHHHHSVFQFEGFTVENHYDIENRYASRKGRMCDDILKKLALENRKRSDGIYLPSATFNGIFLISHAASHFAGSHITLRHLLDWALFVEKEWRDIDWPYVVENLTTLGLLKFFYCMNALSMDVLGISSEKFPETVRDSELETRVLQDILQPSFREKGSGFYYKLRRLKANMWKRNMLASEALVPMMVRLAWSHVRKPDPDRQAHI